MRKLKKNYKKNFKKPFRKKQKKFYKIQKRIFNNKKSQSLVLVKNNIFIALINKTLTNIENYKKCKRIIDYNFRRNTVNILIKLKKKQEPPIFLMKTTKYIVTLIINLI